MIAIYPVVFTPEQVGGYSVFVPDLESNTQGDTLAEAIEMARDVIGLMCMDMEDDGKALPAPSAPADVQVKDGEFVSLVDVDVDA